ncbi:immunity protein [Bacillus atrophaeus]|uniref:immunity protein n=1 Tax=Bacillus atrophaeus TaxID=1452 RepID=UPI00227F9C64|nr:immunity protein [Bacillus atrophaeus]MCY8466859.1 immunity protein [Bacillus atrophaeus]MCY8475800.1 immunity protein [Bacillus atrophaeus]MCY8856523.1 immunity protein [Bacillus atrophaeus]MED1123302.1 immunity protein [Bacillus atrophaeus]MED4799120.1 immunity protein [Bacillus atrophaeus]
MDTMYWIILFLLCIILPVSIIWSIHATNKGKTMIKVDEQIKNELINLDKEFQADKFFINPFSNEKIAFNKDKKLFKIYTKTGNGYSEISIPFSKVIESTIIIDDQTVVKAERGNQIAGALIGGLVAGGIGAIIGGSSPNAINQKVLKKVRLKIVNDDFDCPNYYIDFLPFNEKGYSNTDQITITAIKEVEYWQSIFELAMRKANKVAQ